MKKQPPKYKLRIAELEVDLKSASFQLERHKEDLRSQINFSKLMESEAIRRREDAEKWRMKFNRISDELNIAKRTLSEVSPHETSVPLLQRTIGAVQGALTLLDNQRKQDQPPTLKEYISNNEKAMSGTAKTPWKETDASSCMGALLKERYT